MTEEVREASFSDSRRADRAKGPPGLRALLRLFAEEAHLSSTPQNYRMKTEE